MDGDYYLPGRDLALSADGGGTLFTMRHGAGGELWQLFYSPADRIISGAGYVAFVLAGPFYDCDWLSFTKAVKLKGRSVTALQCHMEGDEGDLDVEAFIIGFNSETVAVFGCIRSTDSPTLEAVPHDTLRVTWRVGQTTDGADDMRTTDIVIGRNSSFRTRGTPLQNCMSQLRDLPPVAVPPVTGEARE